MTWRDRQSKSRFESNANRVSRGCGAGGRHQSSPNFGFFAETFLYAPAAVTLCPTPQMLVCVTTSLPPVNFSVMRKTGNKNGATPVILDECNRAQRKQTICTQATIAALEGSAAQWVAAS